MNKNLVIIAKESAKILHSATQIIIVLGGGLVPGLLLVNPLVSWTGLLIFILTASTLFLLVLLFRLIAHIDSISWYDRKYKMISNKWTYSLGDDIRTLSGECISERRITSLSNSIKYVTISLDKDQAFIPFKAPSGNIVELVEWHRDSGGSIIANQPHKFGDSKFAFRVEFLPPLTIDESAHFKVKYQIKDFKISNLEDLRQLMLGSKITSRDYEVNSFLINFPTDEFIYEIVMLPECKAIFQEVVVERGSAGNFFQEEKIYIDRNCFRYERETNGGWKVRLSRKSPPLKTRYRLQWKPAPTLAMLTR